MSNVIPNIELVKLTIFSHADPQAALQETLTQLGLTYLDLYLVHWPMGNANGGGTQFDVVNVSISMSIILKDLLTFVSQTWKNMEKLPATKLTRFIGISNFNPSQVGELLRSATIKPKVHQIELHPYLAQTEFVRSLQASNITVQAYAPLANSNPNYSTRSRVTQILQHPTIKEIASARGCAPAQVVLGWNIKRGVSVIPKAVVSAHQRENLPTQQKCQLTAADEAKITALSQSQAYRFNAGPCATMAGACFTGLAKGT
jgi:alcohol dehydrogenase (NADP+)